MATEPHSTPDTTTNTTPSSSSTTAIDSGSLYASFHDFPFNGDPGFLSGLSNILGHPGVPVTDAELTQKPDLVLQAKCFYYNRMFRPPTAIDPAGYRRWLAAQEETTTSTIPRSVPAPDSSEATPIPTPTPTQTSTNPLDQPIQPSPSATSTSTSSSLPSAPPPPPYPTSFAAIVDLITNNKPVPGIEEIPDTVLDPGSSKQDTASRRRKPWETKTTTDDAAAVDIGSLAISTTAGREDRALDTDRKKEKEGEEEEEEEEKGTGRGAGVSEMSRYRGRGDGVLRLLQPDAVPDSGLVAKS